MGRLGSLARLGLSVLVLAGVGLALGETGNAGPLRSAVAPDTVTSIEEVARRIEECTEDCSGVVYLWSERMPLSLLGLDEIASAAGSLGVGVTLVPTERLHAFASESPGPGEPRNVIAEELVGSGALAHAPAIVVHSGGRVVGPAILGYKRAEAYEALIRRRLASGRIEAKHDAGWAATAVAGAPLLLDRIRTDYEAVGRPGAYFRWVPGRDALAYESGHRVYLLDLTNGDSRVAPGEIDFVPTPDGRYFVTPAPNRGGLSFYDADAVFDAARAGSGETVGPFYNDALMRDQYPSVGILEQDASRTVYRVLTSWFDAVVYRDYEVRLDPAAGAPSVRPLGDPVTPCQGTALSIPIMSQDGFELAARDEATGTTKIFRMVSGGRCRSVVDLGYQTSKVAWHASGRMLAFAVPRTRARNDRPGDPDELIFLYDRDDRRLTRVQGSELASPLAFPDFIGDDALVYLVPSRRRGESAVFRVLEGIR